MTTRYKNDEELNKALEKVLTPVAEKFIDVTVLGVGIGMLWVQYGWKTAVAAQMFAIFLKVKK
jgi:hypothetical protein